ncbi:E3 ubiquitin-protein ligase FANCL isoform X3 [Lacerta agilis]|uniref:E3 ubiquitin-protein ligase FANCL isoform X3 n=1 Tax=Lacerta agilis TaxID=80427 RepID=UPI00141A0FD5|nr:E3 ubiquitin-protein ligase FANCL isoform X3 [Lacerta agilis]
MAAGVGSLLREFPLLLPQNREKSVYEGFVTAQGRDFHIRILLPSDLQLKNARIQCSWYLKKLLDGYQQILKQRLQHSSDLVSFMVELKTVLYPTEPPDCLVDLPVQFSVSWIPESSLLSIHSQFLAALESLKEFWNALDEIDEKTWVLEPEKPTRSATMRRIAVGNNISINIEVDPRHPTMFPECYFLGADHVVNPLKVKLNSNIHLWDPELSLLQNLKEVLEIDFPSREALEKSDFSMDCGICYAYRLDGTIPDQVCDDPRCGQPFHQVCLYEWLRGLPSSRQSFNVIFGECPYCNKPITLKMSMKKV